MPAFTLAPALTLLAAFQRVSTFRPLRTLVRTTEERLHPRRLLPYEPAERRRQDTVVGSGGAGLHQRATLLRERGRGAVPTIVLGGFVPDATEQVFLLRQFLLRTGDLYYLNYSRAGFSLDLLCAQLDDLVSELNARGQPPVIFGVSFGGGLLLEWLRRRRRSGDRDRLAGVVLVSPTGCIADLIGPGEAKPSTLLGRALHPFLYAAPPGAAAVARSRAVFARMFEAGAQNKEALRTLMTPAELAGLRNAVVGAIHGITAEGAWERIGAMRAMAAPTEYFSPASLPLTPAPVLVLFAEREDAVMVAGAPTQFAFESGGRAYFPAGRVRRVAAAPGQAPVQHASLVFHVFEFLPHLGAFYQRLRAERVRRAA
jgi:hypothetical protein